MEENEINNIYTRKIKIRNILRIISILPVIILLAAMYLFGTGEYIQNNFTKIFIFLVACIFIELIIAVLLRFIWRCPNCSTFLGGDLFSPNYCKNCGEKLRQL
jgi:hypothetical protein